MKCLTTGAAGFIGSNLCISLREHGHDVTTIDNLSTGRMSFLTDLEKVGCKTIIGDYGDIEKLVTESFDVVFHMGAIPRVQFSIEYPVETEFNNVFQTLRLLKWCKHSVGRFVFSSSSAVVGDSQVIFPSDESVKKTPISPYAQQKSSVEEYCRMFGSLYNLDTICLRYFNVFGPRQYGDSPYSTVISAWCDAVKNNKPFRLDGNGSQSRDFCYVDNVVTANINAAMSPRLFRGECLNIAHGDWHTLIQVLGMFISRFPDHDILHAPARQGDVFKTHADISLAKKLINYQPSVSFEDGLNNTWKWWNI